MSEPAAFEFQHKETGMIGYVDQWQIDHGFFESNPHLQLIGPLYRHPPKPDAHSDWQPIETAPREEVYVLLWEPGRPVVLGRYIGYWVVDMWTDIDGRELDPTNWMPLPDPPAKD